MQFIETSFMGLRSARHVFKSPAHPAAVTLFPMLHIGEAGFYDAVYRDALDHDVLLFEGVKSPVVQHLTSSYRWLHGNRLGLVTQPKLPAGAGRAERIHADVTQAEFEAAWKTLPLAHRALYFAYAPWIGLRRRCFATREGLSRGRNVDDLRTRESSLSWDTEEALLRGVLLHQRDTRLCETLAGVLDRNEPQSIAILYGAAHMPAVARMLADYAGFRPAGSEWMTVFGLD
ncbi:hypothetical protein [Leisingera sp. ANG59]|uniref:hypothetical protein n=1 Tax=Leisingera sp. ANG59 TaxID=2675221 RepID=UPI001573B9F9|nr:hypothetical protein [Leisingera sp. ANG59]NSY40559.1 hypothetical protein [Leisingera sp. ANG59]